MLAGLCGQVCLLGRDRPPITIIDKLCLGLDHILGILLSVVLHIFVR